MCPVPDIIFQYVTEIESALSRVETREARIIVPELIGLHRSRPGAHFHPTPEFFLQTGGASEFDCPSGRFTLRKGDLCIMPPGVPHAETPRNRGGRYEVLVLMREGRGLVALRGREHPKGFIQSADVRSFAGGGAAFHCLELAVQATAMDSTFRDGFRRGLTLSFLSAMASALRQPADHVEERHGSPLVTEAERIVRIDIARSDLSVRSVAARSGCSPDHLTRCFQTIHGMSLGVWITRERIQMACDLLARRNLNVAEIGWACGFKGPSYFIRVFKAHTGTTPKLWRAVP